MQLFIDLDGTILDVRSRYYAVYRDILSSYCGEKMDAESFWECKRNKKSIEAILAATGAGDHAAEFEKQWCLRIEQEEYLVHDTVWPEVKEYFERPGVRPILVTMRRNREMLLNQLKRLNLFECFEKVVSVFPDDGQQRHEAKAGEMEKYSNQAFTGENAIIIGDSEADIKAGKCLGIKTAAVTYGIRDKKFLERLKPDCCFETPGELAEFLADTCTSNCNKNLMTAN